MIQGCGQWICGSIQKESQKAAGKIYLFYNHRHHPDHHDGDDDDDSNND